MHFFWTLYSYTYGALNEMEIKYKIEETSKYNFQIYNYQDTKKNAEMLMFFGPALFSIQRYPQQYPKDWKKVGIIRRHQTYF